MALGWRSGYLRYKDYFLNIIAIYKQKQDLRMFLEILLSLGTISFFTAFALKPTVITIISLTREIKSKEETVAKLDTKIQNLTAARTILDSEAARLPLVESSIPSSPSPETFVRQIEGLATRNSVNLLGISIGQVTLLGKSSTPKKDEPGLTPLPEGASDVSFTLSVSGDYPALFSFLSNLEQLRRPIAVDNVGFSATKTEAEKVLVILVTGRVPYLSQQQ